MLHYSVLLRAYDADAQQIFVEWIHLPCTTDQRADSFSLNAYKTILEEKNRRTPLPPRAQSTRNSNLKTGAKPPAILSHVSSSDRPLSQPCKICKTTLGDKGGQPNCKEPPTSTTGCSMATGKKMSQFHITAPLRPFFPLKLSPKWDIWDTCTLWRIALMAT